MVSYGVGIDVWIGVHLCGLLTDIHVTEIGPVWRATFKLPHVQCLREPAFSCMFWMMYVCIHTYVCMYVCMYTRVRYLHVLTLYVHLLLYVLHLFLLICAYLCPCIYVYVCMYGVCIYTHTCSDSRHVNAWPFLSRAQRSCHQHVRMYSTYTHALHMAYPNIYTVFRDTWTRGCTCLMLSYMYIYIYIYIYILYHACMYTNSVPQYVNA